MSWKATHPALAFSNNLLAFRRLKLEHMNYYVQVRNFEASCGPLTQYGMKHMRAFANICNAGIDASKMSVAAAEACKYSPSAALGIWSPVTTGFSA